MKYTYLLDENQKFLIGCTKKDLKFYFKNKIDTNIKDSEKSKWVPKMNLPQVLYKGKKN